MPIHVNSSHRASLKWQHRLALWIVGVVGTMSFFVLCILLTFSPLEFPSIRETVLFISSGLLQLILLPLIMIKQNLDSKHSELRAEAHYHAAKQAEFDTQQILTRIGELQAQVESMDKTKTKAAAPSIQCQRCGNFSRDVKICVLGDSLSGEQQFDSTGNCLRFKPRTAGPRIRPIVKPEEVN